MVLIFSSSANGSVQIKREVNQAIEKEVPVIPFRIEDVPPSGSMEYYLDVTHWLDAVTPPIERHLEKLAEDVDLLLKRTVTSPASLPSRNAAPEIRREPTRNRKQLLWISGAVVAVLLAILVGMLIEGRYSNSPAGDGPEVTGSLPATTPTPATSPGVEPDVAMPLNQDQDTNSASDTCLPGYVWREARPIDHVCVIPEARSKVAQQNALAASRKNPDGGPYGPDTCLAGFVWREAFEGDTVCVTLQEREAAASDNAQAAARVVAN
jgi:hypothetical protein